jgi:hypothetical protein
MKRHIAMGLSILAVAAGMGWKLASRPDHSATQPEVQLNQRSERSQPGPTEALAGIRIRLSGSTYGEAVSAMNHRIPAVAVAAE